jgi:hypothetical protein
MVMRNRVAGTLGALLTACSSVDKQPSFVVRDSAGVSIVESRTPQWAAGAGWRIGDASVRFEPVEVAAVFGAVRLDNGTTVLGDESTARLLFFGADGVLKRAVGRRGDGPGEFRLPQFLGRADDTVWVYDYAQHRVTRFNVDGDLIDVVNLTPPIPSALALGRLADGSLVFMGQWHTGVARNAQGLMRDTIVVVSYRNGIQADTVATMEGREFVQVADETGRMVMSAAIYARRASATPWRDGIVLGAQTDYSLRVVSPDGLERQSIRWAGPNLVLSPADVAEWIDAQVETAPSADRDRLRAMYTTSPVPVQRPAYSVLLADGSGNLWVAEHPGPHAQPSRWDVFAPNGRWLGAIATPDRFRVLDLGRDWVLGVRLDSLDFERLELRSLHTPE